MKTNLLKSIFISLILILGVSNTWAIDFSGGYIYFDNSIGINQTYIQLCARQSEWTGVSTMTNISNTKLHYVANPQGSGWGGILGWVVIGNSSAKSNSNFDNWSSFGWCSNWNEYGFNSGKTYLIVPTSTSKSQSVNTSYYSGGYSGLNSQQTIKSAVNGADANSKATISITSYKMTGNGQVTQQTASLGTGSNVSYITAARTATTTLTVGTVATGYQFDGWYAAKTGGTALSTSTTYTYYPTAATTVYARFSAKKYNITYKDQGNVTFTGTHASGHPTQHTYGTATTLKTATKTGYTFGGWFTNSGCTGSAVTSLGATAYTANITLYAKWTANTYTVAFNANGGTGTMSNQNFTYGTYQNLTANTFNRTNYSFNGWNTQANGKGTSYSDKARVRNLTYTNNGTVTLYAQWQENTIKVTIATNGHGTTSPDREANVGVISGCEIKATPNPGCEFVKWTATEGITITNENSAETTIKATKEGTLTAIFKEKPANTVYLKAATWWKDNDARTAIWAWKENSNPAVQGWGDVDYDDCTGNILRAEIPAKYDRIKFVRLKPSSEDGYNGENNGYHWDNEWNSTETLTVPTDNKNLYDITTNANAHLFFKSNSNWTADGARTAAYFFGNGTKWVSMTDIGDGIYYCEKPSGYTKVIFGRMNPGTNENNFNDGVKWNQTGDLTLPTDGRNLYTISGDLNNLSGKWETEADKVLDSHRWTTYTAPTFNVTINPCKNGTITVVCNDQTYTSSTENVTIPNVTIHTEMNIIFTPADGYILTTPLVTYADVVADNIYSICGPSVISAAFTPRGETRVIYLRPNDDWLHDDAIFVAHAWNSDGNSDYVLTTKDNDYTGSYSCTIDSKYDHILFARLDPADKGNINLENAWNKTKDLEIVESIYTTNNQTRFAIGDKDGDLYDGAWEENTPIWGLTADFNLWHAEDAIFRGYPGKVDILLHSGTHEFLLYNIKTGSYFHNNGTYTRHYSGQWWTMNEQNNCKLVADVDNALYHFQMQYVTQVGEFKNQISITYPSTEVYYLAYQEGDNTKSFRKSHAIDKITEGEKQDTISFFVNVDNTPYLYLLDYADNVLAKHFITGTGGADPNNAMLPSKRNSDATLYVGAGCGVENNGVYNFILLQEGNEAQIDAAATHLYTGSYYIRTDASEGGWNDFRQKSNMMTYSSYAESHSNFNHYFCKWVESSAGTQSNIKFTIANDYSFSLSDTLNSDKFIEKVDIQEGCLPESANVRFGWDNRTNEISRAYIKGAGNKQDRFLVLQGNEHLKDIENKQFKKDGNINDNEVVFDDMGNWIYQIDVTANKDTRIKLTALYNEKTQYFKGTEDSVETILSANASTDYKLRMIYDFKSNHLICGWIANGKDVGGEETLGADMLVIRENQNPASQIDFNNNNKRLNEVGKAYAVMTFTNQFVNNLDTAHKELAANLKQPEHARAHYWISFPFDVKISEIFGFGEYGDQWILQLYDGAARAKEGYWAESEGFWRYITNKGYTLKKGVGYVLTLNLKKMKPGTVFENTDEVSLYFPSTNKIDVIQEEDSLVTTAPAHECTIERDNRKIYDSHWNIIGVPGFVDISNYNTAAPILNPDTTKDGGPSFYYEYLFATNTYRAENTSNTFQTMYGYMVQYEGDLIWSTTTSTPEPIAARRNSDAIPEMVTLRLELAQGEDMEDQTFVQLQQEGATAEFDMNVDMTKIINSGANIYTLTDSLKIQTAGNVLPFEETTVAVGVDIATAGEYTFRMPDGTEGMVVELIDYETNTTTNLLLDDYTVNLPTGSNETRFALSIKPEKTATSIESTTTPSDSNIRKFIIDGKLYLQKDGMLYDAQGHIVR